jgi:hypothetical protein
MRNSLLEDKSCPLATEHPVYKSLAEKGSDRRYAYRELYRAYIDTADIHEIRQCLAANQVQVQVQVQEGN